MCSEVPFCVTIRPRLSETACFCQVFNINLVYSDRAIRYQGSQYSPTEHQRMKPYVLFRKAACAHPCLYMLHSVSSLLNASTWRKLSIFFSSHKPFSHVTLLYVLGESRLSNCRRCIIHPFICDTACPI